MKGSFMKKPNVRTTKQTKKTSKAANHSKKKNLTLRRRKSSNKNLLKAKKPSKSLKSSKSLKKKITKSKIIKFEKVEIVICDQKWTLSKSIDTFPFAARRKKQPFFVFFDRSDAKRTTFVTVMSEFFTFALFFSISDERPKKKCLRHHSSSCCAVNLYWSNDEMDRRYSQSYSKDPTFSYFNA